MMGGGGLIWEMNKTKTSGRAAQVNTVRADVQGPPAVRSGAAELGVEYKLDDGVADAAEECICARTDDSGQ